MTPLSDIRLWDFSRRESVHGNIRIVVELMKLGLLADEFFSSSLDSDEVRQVEPEEENRLLSCLLLEPIDRLLRLFL